MAALLPPQPFDPVVMQCVSSASREFHVPKIVLLGIIRTESRGNPKAIGHNRDGTVDLGVMQINSRWIQKLNHDYGLNAGYKTMMDACYNIRVGSWILSHELSKGGGWEDRYDFWRRVGNYHSHNRYHNTKYQSLLAHNIRWIAANTAWW